MQKKHAQAYAHSSSMKPGHECQKAQEQQLVDLPRRLESLGCVELHGMDSTTSNRLKNVIQTLLTHASYLENNIEHQTTCSTIIGIISTSCAVLVKIARKMKGRQLRYKLSEDSQSSLAEKLNGLRAGKSSWPFKPILQSRQCMSQHPLASNAV